VLAIVAAVLSAAAAASAAAQPPTLRLVRGEPLTVAGQRFHPHERVRLVVDGRVVARTKANARGSFTVTSTGVALDRCLDMAVSVVGASGDRAALAKLPKPACPPALRTP
jgi:hypothetical protein